MKIGRTNASTGGGTTQTPYDEWQEGFGANWDSVVSNAPMTNTQRILHVYKKVDLLKMISTFRTSSEIQTYNVTSGVYRSITMDANKRVIFNSSDSFTNSKDGFDYIAVIYGDTYWGSTYFGTYLPVVYGNSKACNEAIIADTQVNLLINTDNNKYPLLRGIDIFRLKDINLYAGIEHLTCQEYSSTVTAFWLQNLSDCEGRVLRNLIENAPVGTTFTISTGTSTIVMSATFTDSELADWFYNVFFYSAFSKTFYTFYAGNVSNKFKVNSNLQLTLSGYVSGLPEFQYLEGTITEKQDAKTSIGHHGFRGTATKYQQQKNFPLWTVIGGASTGCLRPLQTANVNGSFVFSSLQLERSNFALFNAGVIDTDPTKSFVANLPIVSSGIAQAITFTDTTFKNLFTASEQAQIVSKITGKNWGLTW